MLRIKNFIVAKFLPVVRDGIFGIPPHPVLVRALTCQKTGARRRANRRDCVGTIKPSPLRGYLFKMRPTIGKSVVPVMARKSDVIGQNNDYVWAV
tara:strand:- start:1998 stop:2282 length:285 start_codon:yes stop_codon:yes gene_type:complete